MLHTETVAPSTLELLNRLMSDQLFQDFRLVGGTSLSLQIGHRISIDLDLFSDTAFDEISLKIHLEKDYNLITEFLARETVKGEISGVQIDCIAHKYKWLSPATTIGNIRLASLEDIAAMKLNAITGNGTRIKDFIDIAYLSSIFSFNQMLDFYNLKYNSSTLMPMKAITYFDDINFKEPIKMINGNFSWKIISKRLELMQRHSSKRFPIL